MAQLNPLRTKQGGTVPSSNTTEKMKTPQDITAAIMKATKGTFQSITWKSTVKPSAAFKNDRLEKQTSAVCKAGIDFSNLSSVKTGIANGERGEVESLPWGEWEAFPFTIIHKGERYVRLYPAARSNQVKTQYFLNGKPTNLFRFARRLTPSDRKRMKSGDKPACFTVKEANLIA